MFVLPEEIARQAFEECNGARVKRLPFRIFYLRCVRQLQQTGLWERGEWVNRTTFRQYCFPIEGSVIKVFGVAELGRGRESQVELL